MNRPRLTTQDFIQMAQQIHGNTYGYSQTVYVNSQTPVIITCPNHGDFSQKPTAHSKGCPKCQ